MRRLEPDTYLALRITSGLLRIVGWLSVIFALFVIVFALVVPHGPFAALLLLPGPGLTVYELAGGITILIFGLVLVGFGEVMRAVAAIAINIDDMAINTERIGTPPEISASHGRAASEPHQPARAAAPRAMPAQKAAPPSSGKRMSQPRLAREEFRNVEKELTKRSIAVLQLAREEGYDIRLGDEKTVVVERDNTDTIYFASNHEIEEWGREQGWG